jgi:tetratricopeptide (TPR) repeat protein
MMPEGSRKTGMGSSGMMGLFRILASVFALIVLQGSAQAHGPLSPPDSLNDTQKRTINRLAASKLGNYMYLLQGLASLSGSDEASVEAEDFIENAISDSDPIFNSAEAIIESNIDPEQRPDAPGKNRMVKEYLNEFRLYFRADKELPPLEYAILMRAEPQVLDGRVSTRILYELQFNGRNEGKPGIPYKRTQRVAHMIAVDQGAGNWQVTIATDGFYIPDPLKPFKEYSVDRDLVRVSQGMLAETPQLARLRKEEADAKRKEEQAESDKKSKYRAAIDEGDRLMTEGEPETAIEMYARAQEIDPLSIAHVIKKKRAERDLQKKWQEEIDHALDQLSADLARQIRDNRIRSVAVPEFTTSEGTTTAMGKYLADQVANRLATNGGFKVLFGEKAANAKTEIRGRMLRTGSSNDRVSLTATIMDIKREERQGYAQKELPVPQAFKDSDAVLPPPAKKPEVARWAVGLTAGVNLTSITDADSLTKAFMVNNNGVRVGAEVERIAPKGNSRFATGLRLSQLKCSTAGEDQLRVIDVVYLQLPVLYRLYTNESWIGRFGVQFGGLLDYAVHATTESDVPNRFIEVSNFNAHASPGLCYETQGPKRSHIVANVSYDLMLGGLRGGEFPKEGPRLHAVSFAVGVMF